jgi:glycosyltransferase involved in cell wall biosynthesis
MKPAVTLIIPTYNREEYLFETLESVKNQTFKKWECVIVDDGSDKLIIDQIKKFINFDIRFKLYIRPKSKKKGANACRNIGITNANGKYLIFLDSDDILAQNCLENRINYFESKPNMDFLVFSMGYFTTIKEGFFIELSRSFFNKENNEILREFIFGKKLPWNVTRPIFKRKLVLNNLFNEEIQNFQDDEFNIRLLGTLNPKYLCIDVTDCFYRTDEESKNKYNNPEGFQNIVDSFYPYYKTIFNIFNFNEKLENRKNLILKFENHLNQFVIANLKLKSVKNTIRLYKKELDLSFKEFYSLFILMYLNYYLKNKRGYFYFCKKFSSR